MTKGTFNGIVEKRLEASRFLRSKLSYNGDKILYETSELSETILKNPFSLFSSPLNLIEHQLVEITINWELSSESEPIPLLFSLETFYTDLRRYIEFVTRAVVLQNEGCDKNFSYTRFLNHVCSSKSKNGLPIWLKTCEINNPVFLKHVRENKLWLSELSKIRTALTHFEIRFRPITGTLDASFIVKQSGVIKTEEDFKKHGPIDIEDLKIFVDTVPVNKFVSNYLDRIDAYRTAAFKSNI